VDVFDQVENSSSPTTTRVAAVAEYNRVELHGQNTGEEYLARIPVEKPANERLQVHRNSTLPKS
jgi:hypothetical protein